MMQRKNKGFLFEGWFKKFDMGPIGLMRPTDLPRLIQLFDVHDGQCSKVTWTKAVQVKILLSPALIKHWAPWKASLPNKKDRLEGGLMVLMEGLTLAPRFRRAVRRPCEMGSGA